MYKRQETLLFQIDRAILCLLNLTIKMHLFLCFFNFILQQFIFSILYENIYGD